MKMVEYQHRCEYGGNDVALSCDQGWEHGQLVLIVPKQELGQLLLDTQAALLATSPDGRCYRDLKRRIADAVQSFKKTCA